MAAKHFNVTLAAAAVRLSSVYANPAVGGPDDIPYRQILISAGGADAFIGDDAQVTSTDFGILVDSTALGPASIGPFETGPVKLSDLWAAGAGSTLHLLCIPF